MEWCSVHTTHSVALLLGLKAASKPNTNGGRERQSKRETHCVRVYANHVRNDIRNVGKMLTGQDDKETNERKTAIQQ